MDGILFVIMSLICLPLCIYDLKYEGKTVKISVTKWRISKTSIAYATICIFILFISVFREPFTATDSTNNYEAFKYAMRGGAFQLDYEVGYRWLLNLFSNFSDNFVVYIRFCSLIILFPVFWVVNKLPARSFILTFYIMGVLSATFDVLRGGISFSLILLFYYLYFMRNKKFGFVFMVLAVLFHTSALVYIFIFFIAKYVVKTGKIRQLFIMLIFGILCITPLFETIFNFIIEKGSSIFPRMSIYYGAVGNKIDFSPTYIMMFAIPLIMYWVYNKDFFNCEIFSKRKDLVSNEGLYDFLYGVNYMLFLVALISTTIPVMHRILKFGLTLTYINEGVLISLIRNKRDKFILIAILFAVNIFFAIINNRGLNYSFYFGT